MYTKHVKENRQKQIAVLDLQRLQLMELPDTNVKCIVLSIQEQSTMKKNKVNFKMSKLSSRNGKNPP